MQPKPPRRKQLRTLTCPECQQKGILRELLWGMPGEDFDHDKYASGGCVIPSAWPPDCRCSGCGFQGYRDFIPWTESYPLSKGLQQWRNRRCHDRWKQLRDLGQGNSCDAECLVRI